MKHNNLKTKLQKIKLLNRCHLKFKFCSCRLKLLSILTAELNWRPGARANRRSREWIKLRNIVSTAYGLHLFWHGGGN